MRVRPDARSGFAASVVASLAIAALSRLPYAHDEGTDGLLRLAWRAPGERVEECRTPSPADLAGVPIHMRRAEVCEGRFVPYKLTLYIGGESVLDEVVLPSGARADRPLYVFHEIPVPAGMQEIRVTWASEAQLAARRGRPLGNAREGAESDPAVHRAGEAVHLNATLEVQPEEVVLVTYDATNRALIVHTAD